MTGIQSIVYVADLRLHVSARRTECLQTFLVAHVTQYVDCPNTWICLYEHVCVRVFAAHGSGSGLVTPFSSSGLVATVGEHRQHEVKRVVVYALSVTML